MVQLERVRWAVLYRFLAYMAIVLCYIGGIKYMHAHPRMTSWRDVIILLLHVANCILLTASALQYYGGLIDDNIRTFNVFCGPESYDDEEYKDFGEW